MGDRYYLSGAQLGCLMSQSLDKKEVKKILDEIHEKQHLGTRDDLKEYFKITKKLNEGLHKLRCVR